MRQAERAPIEHVDFDHTVRQELLAFERGALRIVQRDLDAFVLRVGLHRLAERLEPGARVAVLPLEPQHRFGEGFDPS
jgi:hypothetical protein